MVSGRLQKTRTCPLLRKNTIFAYFYASEKALQTHIEVVFRQFHLHVFHCDFRAADAVPMGLRR